jgi:acyl carrier protein
MHIDIDTIKQKMAGYLKLPLDVLQDSSEIASVVPDSFLLVELLIELQEDYDIRIVQADLQNIKTVADLAGLIAERASAREAPSTVGV